MNIRKFFFWFHLIIGCSAAIFIFLMSITGVGLTYERQMIQSAQVADFPVAPSENATRLSLDNVIAIAKTYDTEKEPSISFSNENNAPFIVKEGRKTLAYLNPFTGKEMLEPGQQTKVFFGKLRAFHRWLTLDGKFSETGRWVNGISNVIFCLLALTGLYLWLPAKFKKRAFKQKLIITKNHKNGQARDYQWHNTFGFYMAPLLIVITFTAFFFSFKWPGNTLKTYVSSHEEALPKAQPLKQESLAQQLSMQTLWLQVNKDNPDWQTVSLSLSAVPQSIQTFQVDMGNGGEPQKRKSVLVNTLNGDFIAEQNFEDYSTYRKARSYIRFLHTGEIYGLVGQTLAGLASLLACLLVYTGIAMSLRRWQRSRNSAGK
ncbi:PepSY-associated TM helix domain-containing protein [Pseudocolwellia agarivorans]|uniref:PepSY-associated TM helix domain-containing protein n=1 Tax=Pseudocolwellia agarivorans TaxID=1911682 RepID=UPI000985C1B1|nr:PepSY-associated TM helix domain-containing protein [Pseudocolwellia agarivorans]